MRTILRAAFAIALTAAPAAGVALAASPVDRASTEAALSELERDPATKESVADAAKQARLALDRATRMKAAGDDVHARLAEALAHDWAVVAQEQARATAAEQKAAIAHAAAGDAGAQTHRARAMLEQRLAENGRLTAEVAAAEARADAGPRDSGSKTDPSAPPGAAPRKAGSK